MSFHIAFFADSHIGYRVAKVPSTEAGINIRVQDGYDAFRETLNQIITSEPKIDAVIHGGDLFHTSKPSVRDTTTVLHYLRGLAKHGIPFYGIAGNHDATDIRSEMAAVAPVNDPDRKLFALYRPYEQYNLTDGLVLHAVAHHGLGEDAPEVKPVADKYNLFTTHGAALDPKNKALLRCQDSPREQIIPNELVTDDNFIAKLLGHYHSRYPVGGIKNTQALNTWYSGSALRRGFSDEVGERGWLLVEIRDDGHVKVTPKNIHQRPQFDLEEIDALELTGDEVMDMLSLNMKRTMDVDESPIVRQRIINASRGVKEGLDKNKLRDLSAHMLMWQLEFPKVEQAKSAEKQDVSFSGRHSVNILDQFSGWMKTEINSVPEEYRDTVEKDIRTYLTSAREAAL